MGRLGATTGSGEVCEIPIRIACRGVPRLRSVHPGCSATRRMPWDAWLRSVHPGCSATRRMPRDARLRSVHPGCSATRRMPRTLGFARCTRGVCLHAVCLGCSASRRTPGAPASIGTRWAFDRAAWARCRRAGTVYAGVAVNLAHPCPRWSVVHTGSFGCARLIQDSPNGRRNAARFTSVLRIAGRGKVSRRAARLTDWARRTSQPRREPSD
jgi:hypothetical protein